MQRVFLIITLLCSLGFPVARVYAQTIWTVGPMLHINFGGEKTRASWGLEFAYWNFAHFPYSIDMAAEFEKKKSGCIPRRRLALV